MLKLSGAPSIRGPLVVHHGTRLCLCRSARTAGHLYSSSDGHQIEASGYIIPPSDEQAVAVSRRGVAIGAMSLVTAAAAQALGPAPAMAGLSSYNVTGKEIQEVTVRLGNEVNQFVFEPSVIELTAGRLTKLKLVNPSNSTHYFTALEFADKIYTVLVLAGDPAVEVKGKVQEVALKAGASATWVLMPIKAGSYPLSCTVKGHAAGGMVGTIVVKEA